MKSTRTQNLFATALAGALAATTTFAADAPKMKMTTPIPPEITTPDSVETPTWRAQVLRRFSG
jgi:hypothetical protein